MWRPRVSTQSFLRWLQDPCELLRHLCISICRGCTIPEFFGHLRYPLCAGYMIHLTFYRCPRNLCAGYKIHVNSSGIRAIPFVQVIGPIWIPSRSQCKDLVRRISTGAPQDLLTRTCTRSCEGTERISVGPHQELLTRSWARASCQDP